MSAQIIISMKAIGRKSSLVPDFDVPVPPETFSGGEPLTLRDLITRIVVHEVEAFKKRQKERKHSRTLSVFEIQTGLEKGKVDSGGRELQQEVDAENAVGTALQAFEDGLYLVILDGEEQRDLEKQIILNTHSHVVFLRMTMLAGA